MLGSQRQQRRIRRVTIFSSLMSTPLSDLDLSRYEPVPSDLAVSETVSRMAYTGESCALLIDDGELRGVFTQRDVVHRVIGRHSTFDQPIRELATSRPRTIDQTGTVEEALAIMNEWWVRSVPVLDGERVVGNLSYYTIMRLIARGVMDRTSTGEPQVRHGLELVDFTGLNTSAPVIVKASDTADVPLHHMRTRAIGSVVVTDERENLVGIVTEWDLVTHLGCHVADPSTVDVGSMMSGDVVALSARSSIAEAIGEMASRGFSNIPLLGESGRPVGVASFLEVSAYFERGVAVLS
jgi:CBS domain-containing protein